MPVEIVGLHFFCDSSESRPLTGVYDVDFVRQSAIAHEESGYDRVLIGQNASWPDGLAAASYISAVTTKLKFMMAHRPGFVAPTMAARQLITLDQLSRGRAGVHIITGASDIETQADGDFLTKAERYRRSYEYVQIMRRMWTSATPIDHDGPHYKIRGGFSSIKPHQASIPVYWGGSSEGAIAYGAEVADVYAFGGMPVAQAAELVSTFKAEAAKHGRDPGMSMSMRVIIGDTEAQAWDKAHAVLDAIVAYQATKGLIGRDKGPGDTGTRSLIEMAEQGDILDERLWTGITRATAGRTHATTLVGTPQQVTEALMRYYDVGVDRFLITGYDTLTDVVGFGRELIPMIREAVARKEAG